MTTADATPRGASLREAKLALRGRILAARDALPAATRAAAAAAIAARIVALPSFVAARCVLLTLAFRSEWDTAPLLAAACAAGKAIAVPRVDTATRMLDLHALGDLARDVRPGHLGIPEPLATTPRVRPAEVDWVLVPGVAFDVDGRRLGYGGGYYDRLLPMLRKNAARVAGAYELQIVERVPAAPHDREVDAIVTESRVIELAR